MNTSVLNKSALSQNNPVLSQSETVQPPCVPGQSAQASYDAEGYPVNLAAAGFDALDWLAQFYNADGLHHLKFASEADRRENEERLKRCILALQKFLTPLMPEKWKEP